MMLLMMASMLISAIVLIIVTISGTRSFDTQVPVGYSSFGNTNIHSDKWYGLLSFGLFGIIVLGFNGYFAVKARVNNRGMAIIILALSLFIFLMSFIVTFYVFRLPK